MENKNIAMDIMSRVRTGARGAFLLSKQGHRSDLCFGACVVENVEFLIWLASSNFNRVLTHRDITDETVEFIFDSYGSDQTLVRFALACDGKGILDSNTTPIVGIFAIHTSACHKTPLSMLGLIVHKGDDPVSIFIADRSNDLITFSGALAQLIQLLDEGSKNG